MNPDRWDTLQALFDQALTRPEPEREPFLREACAGDKALFHEVASLLNVEVHTILDGLAVDAVDLPAVFSMEGEHVGPYRIEREIGRGGMGAVYRAERADGAFDHTVALKLVKRGMDSEAVLGRFLAERQILARLNHPNIARLLDGGLHADGRPYFAMEYVEGEPITAYCDARALGVDERLALFAKVGEAVAYAHRALVVHRDLKPSNILVTPEGEVKLLDFGIAKLLDTDAGPELTWSGFRPMTPEYASPEQLRGEPVTTATDVYALGVLLYELLTGRRPHVRDRHNLATTDTTTVATRPSTSIAHTISTPTASGVRTVTPVGVSQARSTTPDKLRRRLAGDLDTLVLKTLRDEADQRYNSVELVLADLERERAGEPILARRASVGYRMRKFVARHRVGVATAVGIVVVLTGVVTAYTVRLAAERDRAQLEAAKATEVAGFLEALFTSSDPAESRGADVTARVLLAEGAERIENDLTNQPAVQAQMYGTIGRVYESLGLLEEADTTLQQSLRLHSAVGSDPLAIARTQADLAGVYTSQSNFATADSLLQFALLTQRAAYSEPHEDLARSLKRYGDLLLERGDYPDAEAPYREALHIQQALHGDDHSSVADLLARLGTSYGRMGRYREAAQMHEEALALHRRIHGALHPATTESLREASTSYRRLDAFDKAEGLIREAIALDSQLVGPEHPSMSEDYYQYASLLSDMGRFDEATAMFERSLAIDQVTLGQNHPYVAITLGDLGQVRQRAGDRVGAISYFRRGVEMARRELPPDHPQLAGLLHKLGEALGFTGDLAEAEQVTQEALSITRARLGDDHVQVLSIRSALGSLYTQADRHAEAVALHRDVLERRLRTQGDSSAITARSYYNLAGALRAQGTTEALAEARAVAAEALERYRAVFPETSLEVGYAHMEQADVLRASGDHEGAAKAYREAGRTFEAALGADHPVLGRIKRSLEAIES